MFKPTTFLYFLLLSILISCTTRPKEDNITHDLDSKLVFANKALTSYIQDTITSNYLYSDLDWQPFKNALYDKDFYLIKKYTPNAELAYLEKQMIKVSLEGDKSVYFSNYTLIKNEDNDSLTLTHKTIYGLTLPVFNENENVAFVGVSVSHGFLSGYGELLVLKKESNKWKEVDRIHLWMN